MAIPSGEIYLLSNVPLTASYEHTIDFKDKDEQFKYFSGFIKYTFDKYSYIRKEREYLTFELPVALADEINYMLFRSADGERLYYCFVGNKRYVNKSVTEISYEIDVMQTFMFDYKFNASYIRQAHVDRWTADHKPIYSKTDEGLNYGSEYVVENAYRIEQSDLLRWLLVSVKEYSAVVGEGYADMPALNPAPSPFACFLLPVVVKLDGNNQPYPVRVGGADNIATYNDFVNLMRKNAIGNYIHSISLLTYNPFINNAHFDGSNINVYFNSVAGITTTQIDGLNKNILVIANAGLKSAETLAVADWDIGLEDTLPTSDQWAEVKQKPYTTKRDKRFESKLLCAPYRYNLLSDWRNAPLILKNEYMTTDKLTVKYSYGLSYNTPFRFWIENYKRDVEGRNATLSQPLGLEFPVISDNYYTYMLENKNTIQANLTNTIINASSGVVSGAVNGASGGVAGAVVGGVMGAVGGVLNVQSQLRSENAKQADLKAVPDTILNSVDSSFNIVDNNAVVTFYRMRLACEYEEILAEIFNMSGYKVNRVEIPNLRSRARFNYIQTLGANITGSFSQSDILKIKSIFDNGITIWHYYEGFKILDYTLENIEVNLL